ncbi:extensin family protein [Qipengyuania sp. MTN3-11]|uniref:extensin family protein n=1 Tax=Qipengyuania sp. MTN3-11 TaxID=3056557 RepID=UPI0036F3407F
MLRYAASIFLGLALASCGAIPAGREQARVEPRAVPHTGSLHREESSSCLAELGAGGSRFAPLPDRYYGAGCQTVDTVALSALMGDAGEFALSNLGPVTCPVANRFAGWARYGVDRAARQILGSALVRIETMGSYSCRNIAGSNRRSAHSRSEAIDVAAFVLADGRRISVKAGWDASREEREFLRTVHRSACKRFGTVLGPDYNSAHEDHFHLEQGDGSFCR